MCCARKTLVAQYAKEGKHIDHARSFKWCKHSSCTITISVGKLQVYDLIELNWAIVLGFHCVRLDKHVLAIMPPQPSLSCVSMRFVEAESKGEEESYVLGWMPKTGSMSNDKIWWLSTHPGSLESVTWQVIFSCERVAFESKTFARQHKGGIVFLVYRQVTL